MRPCGPFFREEPYGEKGAHQEQRNDRPFHRELELNWRETVANARCESCLGGDASVYANDVSPQRMSCREAAKTGTKEVVRSFETSVNGLCVEDRLGPSVGGACTSITHSENIKKILRLIYHFV